MSNEDFDIHVTLHPEVSQRNQQAASKMERRERENQQDMARCLRSFFLVVQLSSL
jgi:5,10-methylenetetrahydrofolate reductase